MSGYPSTHFNWVLGSRAHRQWQGLSGLLGQLDLITRTMYMMNGQRPLSVKDQQDQANRMADWAISEMLVGPYDEVAFVELQCLLHFKVFDRQIFMLNPIIQEMFDNTDVKRVGRADINKMPYPCFYMNLKDSSLKLKDPSGTEHRVSGFYVLRDNSDPDVDKLTFFIHAEGPNSTFGSKYYFSIGLDHCFSEFNSVGDYVKSICKDPSRDSSSPGLEITNAQAKHHVSIVQSVYRIFAAFLMYLNTDDPSLREDVEKTLLIQRLEKKIKRAKKESKKKKYATQLGRAKQRRHNYTYVGEREEKNILQQLGPRGYQVERHWRRGHDHRFWHGPLKNKETGEDWSKVPEGVLPEDFWEGKRELRTQWLEPRLIHPEKEYVERDTGRDYKLLVPATYLEKRQILDDMYSAMEGKSETVTLTRPERSRKNQQACFKHWGFECRICGFDPVKDHPLGEMVENLPSHGLEAHHLTPLGNDADAHEVSAIDDMRPLCSVCHKVVHARGPKYPPRDVEEMRSMVLDELSKRANVLHGSDKAAD